MGFHDFAGSTVVHTIGGFIALAGAIVLGPRLGRKFTRDGGGPMMPHDLTIAVSGGLILWFGWYGFNPGSTLSAMDLVGIGRVAANTTLAACAGGLTSIFYGYMKMQKVGRQLHNERIPGWTGGYHLSLLLGQPNRISAPRRYCRRVGHRGGGRPRISPHRRSHRRGSGTRHLRHLGNAFTGLVCQRPVRSHRPARSGQLSSSYRLILRRGFRGA